MAQSEANLIRLREITCVLARRGLHKGLAPEKLRLILEDLGPTYIKLGQIMSMRSDMLPKAYCDELTKLRSDAAPMPFAQVRRALEAAYGRPLEQVFASFEETPLGSASIAQAHRAALATGEQVVVKVQREGIYDTMSRDMALLRQAARLLKYTGASEIVDLNMVLDEMWAVAQQEMDFLQEAANLEEFAQFNRDAPFIDCPALYREYTTRQVLVMEYIDGPGVDQADDLRSAGCDMAKLGGELADNYVKQVVEDGFFHADPHPGNLKVRGGKIVFLDMGMMGRLSRRDQRLIAAMLEGVARGDVNKVKEGVLALGEFRGRVDQQRLYTDIDDLLLKYGAADLGGMDLARMMEDLMEAMKANQIAMPRGLSMLARGMATLEGVLAKMSPDIDLVTIAANRVAARALADADWQKEIKKSAQAVYESSRKALDIPSLTADALRTAIKGQTRLNVDLRPAEGLTQALLRAANRLALGLAICALIVGASILCAAPLEPRLLGVPVHALFGYALALVLALSIPWRGRRQK